MDEGSRLNTALVKRPDHVDLRGSVEEQIPMVLAANGPMSASEIAEIIGCSAASIYAHIPKLKGRKIRVTGQRPSETGRGSPASLFDVIPGKYRIPEARPAPRSPRNVHQLDTAKVRAIEQRVQRGHAVQRIKAITGSKLDRVMDRIAELNAQKKQLEVRKAELDLQKAQIENECRSLIASLALPSGPDLLPSQANGRVEEIVDAQIVDSADSAGDALDATEGAVS